MHKIKIIMSENHIKLIDRKTLVQINATIIAGMLIFLTIGEFSPEIHYKEIILISIIAGFGCLVLSMMICFATEEKIKIGIERGKPKIISYADDKLANNFRYAEILFLVGILLLFVSVSLVMGSKLFWNA